MTKNLEEDSELPPNIDLVDDLDTTEIDETDSINDLDKKNKQRQQGHQALKTRRAIEDKLEEVRLRKELDYLTSENLDDDDDSKT